MTTEGRTSRSGFFGVFVLGLAALCLTAIWGTGSHIGNNSFHMKPATTRLASALMEMKIDPQLTDESVQAVVAEVVRRAREGDVEAAAFVAELAVLQRQQPSVEEPESKLAVSE